MNERAELEFTRTYRATPEEVYAAWTEPERMKRWLHPSPEWVNPSIEVDLRVGGTYRIEFLHAESGERAVVGGAFVEVEPRERLAYTWAWEAPHEYEGVETLVRVGFEPVDGGTRVRLRQSRFSTRAMEELHREGWAGALACYASSCAAEFGGGA